MINVCCTAAVQINLYFFFTSHVTSKEADVILLTQLAMILVLMTHGFMDQWLNRIRKPSAIKKPRELWRRENELGPERALTF